MTPRARDATDHTDGDREASVARSVRGGGLNLIGSAVSAVASFALVAVVTNTYGSEGAGVFFGVTSTVTLAANGLKLGAETGLVYWTTTARSNDRQVVIPVVLRSGLGLVAVVSALAAVVGLVAASPISTALTDAADAPGFRDLLVATVVAVPALAVGQVAAGASRGFSTMRPTVFATQLFRPSAQLAGVAAVVLLDGDVVWLGIAWAAPTVLAAGWLTRWLWRRTAHLRGATAPVSPVGGDASETRRFWSYTAPRGVADLAHAGLEKFDVIALGAIAGPGAAGVYFAANRLANLGQMSMFALTQSAAPELGRLFARDDDERAAELVQLLTVLLVTVLWPLFIVFALFAEPLLSVFGDGFDEGSTALVILSVGMLLVAAGGPGDVLLTMSGRSGRSLGNHLIALAINVGLNLVLIPAHGATGAAIAWVGAIVTMRYLAVSQTYLRRGVHPFSGPLAAAAVLAVVLYGGTGFVLRSVVGNTVPAAVLTGVVAAVLQLGVLLRHPAAFRLEAVLALVPGRAPALEARARRSP